MIQHSTTNASAPGGPNFAHTGAMRDPLLRSLSQPGGHHQLAIISVRQTVSELFRRYLLQGKLDLSPCARRRFHHLKLIRGVSDGDRHGSGRNTIVRCALWSEFFRKPLLIPSHIRLTRFSVFRPRACLTCRSTRRSIDVVNKLLP